MEHGLKYISHGLMHTFTNGICLGVSWSRWDVALQVSNAVMGASDPGESLTKFICNIEARVFADMQSAPPQELNENYGLPVGGRQAAILSLSSKSVLAILDDKLLLYMDTL